MDMSRFFNPKSIVVFGVSDIPTNLGRIIIGNLERFSFQGSIYAIGPSGGVAGERKIFKSLSDIQEVPELAVILVPSLKVPAILDECGKKGIAYAIIESGGFTEFSSDRGLLEGQINEIAERYKMGIIGPNCFGVVNINKGVVLPFFILSPDYMRSGRVSLISQSGGIFYDTCMISSCENLGLAKVISIGNKLAIDENTCLEYLIDDPDTGVIGLYLEHFSNGRRFMEIVSSTEKPIVLLKANRGETSREIARFHTAALAGDDDVARAAMKQAGVILVKSFHEMVECLKVFCLEGMKGDRLAVISRSGGHSVLAADSVDRYGLKLARYSDRFLDFVRSKKLNVIRATNPLDVGDVYDLSLYTEILEEALKEDDGDGVVFIITYSSETDGIKVQGFIRDAAALSRAYRKPVALSVITNKDEWFPSRNAADVPLFSDCDIAIWAMSKSLEHTRAIEKRRILKDSARATQTIQRVSNVERHHHHSINRQIINQEMDSEMASPSRVFEMLKGYGLPVAEQRVAQDVEEAIAHASLIGYPVVLKDASPHILHRTERKGVILNICSEKELREAIKHMGVGQFLIQPMYPQGIEIIIGVRYDRDFGHVILVGSGGIYSELFRDVSMRILPLNEYIAEEMLEELKANRLLKGFRGAPPSDRDVLKKIMVGVSKMVLENPSIKELDINPVIVYKDGEGAVIVDGKMRLFF